MSRLSSTRHSGSQGRNGASRTAPRGVSVTCGRGGTRHVSAKKANAALLTRHPPARNSPQLHTAWRRSMGSHGRRKGVKQPGRTTVGPRKSGPPRVGFGERAKQAFASRTLMCVCVCASVWVDGTSHDDRWASAKYQRVGTCGSFGWPCVKSPPPPWRRGFCFWVASSKAPPRRPLGA
jgi:hypothetical protein